MQIYYHERFALFIHQYEMIATTHMLVVYYTNRQTFEALRETLPLLQDSTNDHLQKVCGKEHSPLLSRGCHRPTSLFWAPVP